MFDRCRQRLAAVTLVQYKYDPNIAAVCYPFVFFRIIKYSLAIEFHVYRCRRRLAAVTLVQYKYDPIETFVLFKIVNIPNNNIYEQSFGTPDNYANLEIQYLICKCYHLVYRMPRFSFPWLTFPVHPRPTQFPILLHASTYYTTPLESVSNPGDNKSWSIVESFTRHDNSLTGDFR